MNKYVLVNAGIRAVCKAWNARNPKQDDRTYLFDALWNLCNAHGVKFHKLETDPLRVMYKIGEEICEVYGGHVAMLDCDEAEAETTGIRHVFYGGLTVSFRPHPEKWDNLQLQIMFPEALKMPDQFIKVTHLGDVELEEL